MLSRGFEDERYHIVEEGYRGWFELTKQEPHMVLYQCASKEERTIREVYIKCLEQNWWKQEVQS